MVRTRCEIKRAIKELKARYDDGFAKDLIPEYYEALEIAIEALNKELTIRECMEDDRK